MGEVLIYKKMHPMHARMQEKAKSERPKL